MAIKEGSKVKVHYTGKHEDGSVFDSSEGREPLELTVGQDNLIPGFVAGLMGMNEGEEKTIEIEPDQAYGDVREDLMTEVDKSQLPEGTKEGQILQAETNAGPMTVTVKEFKGDKAVIDANHPLAGKKLIFDLKAVEVA